MTPEPPQPADPTPRRRRVHRKSRKGCSECKARHIKCDEGRPRCVNCVTTSRCCSFPISTSFEGPADSVATPAVSTRASDAASDTREAGVYFTATHLTCLHHAEVHMEKYMSLHGSARPIIDLAINHSLTAPFLLDQMLALSALHLSVEAQDNAATIKYHQQATELQTRALELFNQAREENCETNCIPVFLFASLLGIHVLRETLVSHRNDLSAFIDAFIQYVHLHRGVRTVIANGTWTTILQSDLKPLLYLSSFSDDVDRQTPGEETRKLLEFLGRYKADPDSICACQRALERVQWMLDVCKRDTSRDDVGIHATMAWPLLVPQEYIEALHQRRPEAFAVLAFYAAALHHYRGFWVFGNSGSSLFSAISDNIGSYWRDNLGISIDTLLAR